MKTSYIEKWQDELTDKIFEMNDYFIERNIDPKTFLEEYKILTAHLADFIEPLGVKQWKTFPLAERTFFLKTKLDEYGENTITEMTNIVISEYNSTHKKTQLENVDINDLMFIIMDDNKEKIYER